MRQFELAIRVVAAIILFLVLSVFISTLWYLVFGESNGKLQEAVRRNDATQVLALLNSGEDVNDAQKFRHWTALHVAADEGYSTIAAILIKRGAKIDCRDDDGYTPLCVAGSQPSGQSQPPSSETGRNEVASLLIANGANTNVKTKHGDTPLFCAAKSGDAALIQMLLSANADPSITNVRGNSALDYAKEAPKERKLIKQLLEAATLKQRKN